jgi:hypothetical protein
MQTTVTSYRLLTADLPAALGRVARQPQVRRENEHYLATIGHIKSLDAFIGSERIYQYAMQAFGLQGMAYAKALIRRVLSEGIDRPDSLANRLADPRFRELAQTFNFNRYGPATTSFARTQQGTVDRYVQQVLESQAGSSNEGVRLALYFRRKAPGVTTPYALMADRALLKVTQVMLDLPARTAAFDIDRQADLISKRLDIADLENPQRLDKLLTRFTALWDIEKPVSADSPIVDLMAGDTTAAISPEILIQLQNLRKGG